MPLEIVYRPIADLVPYAQNARKHPRAQLDKLKAAILRFGWGSPLAIAGDGVLAGHGRLIVAAELRDDGIPIPGNPGLDVVPTIDLSHLSDTERRAYILADNKIAADAGWDMALLAGELSGLRLDGFDLSLTGFDANDLALVFPPEGFGPAHGSLAAAFGVPPFSVLNAREGWWQDRKRTWLALGIQSELGRGDSPGVAPGGAPMPLDRAGGQAAAAFKNQGKLDALRTRRPANATPGGHLMPSTNYGKTGARGDGRGRTIS